MTSHMARTCVRHADGTLRSPMNPDFIWPNQVGAIVTAPDWNPEPVCGGGLHGLRPGQQKPGHWVTGPDAVYLVCSFEEEDAVDLDGSVKVRQCRVECVGTAADYTNFLTELGYTGLYGACFNMVWDDKRGCQKANSGIYAGNDSSIIAGSSAYIEAGDHADIISNYNGYLKSGACSTLNAGAGSVLIGGPSSELKSADTGDVSVLIGGVDSTFESEGAAMFVGAWFDSNTKHIKHVLGFVQEEGNALQPSVTYHVVNGAFVEMSA